MAALFCAAVPAFGAGSGRWVEVKSPHFVVVSNAGESNARQTAIQFEQIRSVFREVLPITQEHSGPVITILAVKDEKSLSELLPEFWTKGHAHPAGLFENSMNQFYIAIELDASGPNPYETIYHEYYHSLTMPYYPDMPTWLSEGLADFFGNSEVGGKTAIIGESSSPLLYQLVNSSMIPLDTLFKVDRSSPYYNEESKVTIFYAESWALVHYLMIGDNQAHRPMLSAYLQALSGGATEEAAAVKAFGDLKKLQSQLEDYIRRNSFYQLHLPAPAKIPESDLKARALSEADADAYEGGFLVTRGRTQEAKTALDRAIQLDPKNARAHQNMAITQYSLGQRPEALASASQAIEFDPGSMLARYLRAYLTFNEEPGAKNPQIEEDLRAAIGGSPEFAPPYGLLAVYMTSQDENLTEALALAEKAILLEPGNSDFQLSEAQVLMRMKNFAAARTALQRARVNAATSQQSLQADMYLSSLDEMEKYANRSQSLFSEPNTTQGSGELTRRDGTSVEDDLSTLEATGTVDDVTCTGGLKLRISTANGIVSLHDAPGGSVKIVATSEIAANFSPCSLKGSRITVRYVADGADAHNGTVEVLQLLEAKP
jgi:tetratricopeptide (TPR) repeat protein